MDWNIEFGCIEIAWKLVCCECDYECMPQQANESEKKKPIKRKNQLNFSSIHLLFRFIFDHFLCLQNKRNFQIKCIREWQIACNKNRIRFCDVWLGKMEIYNKIALFHLKFHFVCRKKKIAHSKAPNNFNYAK